VVESIINCRVPVTDHNLKIFEILNATATAAMDDDEDDKETM